MKKPRAPRVARSNGKKYVCNEGGKRTCFLNGFKKCYRRAYAKWLGEEKKETLQNR